MHLIKLDSPDSTSTIQIAYVGTGALKMLKYLNPSYLPYLTLTVQNIHQMLTVEGHDLHGVKCIRKRIGAYIHITPRSHFSLPTQTPLKIWNVFSCNRTGISRPQFSPTMSQSIKFHILTLWHSKCYL